MAEKGVHQFDLNLSAEEDVNLVDEHQPKRRRHTQHQIQKLEAFYKDERNPDHKQQRALGLELGLEPQQVKYWFQNKRIQQKTRHGHRENMELHAENARLKLEKSSYSERLKSVTCVRCGGPLVARREISDTEHQLRAKNAQLRAEIDRVSAIATQFLGKPITDSGDDIPRSTTQ